MSSDRRGATDATGAALIEFALCLPLLLLLIVGIFDFGFLFQKYEVLTNAAREGARMAVLPGYSSADVEQRVTAYLTAGGVSESATTTVVDDTVPLDFGSPLQTKRVTVTLNHTFTLLGPIATLFGSTFGTTQLTAISQMRTEVPAGGT